MTRGLWDQARQDVAENVQRLEEVGVNHLRATVQVAVTLRWCWLKVRRWRDG